MGDKLKNCKACNQEIGKRVKKCPSCGADQRNFFGRHKILTVIVALVIIGGIIKLSSPATTTIKTKDGRSITAYTMTFPDGRKYVGELKDGKAQGYGILYAADGSIKYEGEFIDGTAAAWAEVKDLIDEKPASAPAPAKNKPTITKTEFDQIKSGMTYEEVTGIIGGPGEVLSESGNPGDQYHTVMYQYKGEGDLGANANMMFQGNKLMNKAQMGLK